MTPLLDRWKLFSLREFRMHRGRTLASMTVMAVSAAFLVAVFGIFGSLTSSVHQLVDGLAGEATLEVSGVTDAGFPAAIQAEVKAVPGVAHAVPMSRAKVPSSAGSMLVLGTDATASVLKSDLQDAVEQRHITALAATEKGVLVGPGVGVPVGARMRLGGWEVTVAGVLSGERLERLNEGHYVLASLPLAQFVTGRTDRIDSVLIVPQPGVDVAALRTAVDGVVAGRALVAEPSLRAVQTGGGVRMMQYMTLMGAALAFIVAAFLIYTAMGMAIVQRRQTISMLRAIGGRRSTIVADLLVEAAVIGVIGGAVGALLGIVMGRIAIGTLPVALMQSMEARMVYSLPLYAIPIAIAAAAVTSMAASAVAAHQVYKVSPVEALAPVGAGASDQVPTWLRLGAAGGALFNSIAAIVLVRMHLGAFLWSGLALSLFFGAGLMACFAAAGPLVAATALVARAFGRAGELAAATLERAPRRVWATMMTVFLAVAITVTTTGANNDLLGSMRGSMGSVAEVDVWVSSHPPDQFPTGPALPARLPAAITALPQVEQVAEAQVAYATLGAHKVMLYGMAAGAVHPLADGLTPEQRAALVSGRGVALSRDMARTLDVDTGDALTIQTPRGPQQTTVLGVVSYFSALTGTIGMGLDQMREWFDRPGATLLQVEAKPGADPKQLLETVRGLAPDAQVYSGAAALAAVEDSAKQGMAVSTAMWVIVVLIAAIALLNTLTLSVLERRREIGVLRAMGSSRRVTLRMVLAEAAGIGIVGGVLGLGFGLASQYFFDSITPNIMNVEVPYQPSPAALMFAAGAVLLSLLGSIPPAVRAARLNIIDAVSAD
ncbi:ABC transporter permease [Nocardia sp. XZ_19_385]|uniref:ABC transporter permease n=1 Tax=Nocardia sp. XZ_19_385 TaxID=2769488 RepID=UPI0018906C2A|nr:ABC transporter permease [Nocardia sp. XZ_19_385]